MEADDFDDEALQDAREYNLLRELKAQKGRKGKGALKANPARARVRDSPVKRRFWEDPSEDEPSESDDGSGRRTRRPRNDRELRYEGRECTVRWFWLTMKRLSLITIRWNGWQVSRRANPQIQC